MKRAFIMALEMALLSALCACGNVESGRNTMEVHAESTEPGIWYRNGGESGQTYQTGQEMTEVLKCESIT